MAVTPPIISARASVTTLAGPILRIPARRRFTVSSPHSARPYRAPASTPAVDSPVVAAIAPSRTNWTATPMAGPRPAEVVTVPALTVTVPPGGKIGPAYGCRCPPGTRLVRGFGSDCRGDDPWRVR